jgi:L-lysine 2,3-aminomutase
VHHFDYRTHNVAQTSKKEVRTVKPVYIYACDSAMGLKEVMRGVKSGLSLVPSDIFKCFR